MTLPTTTRQWLLAAHPTGLPSLSGPSTTFTLTTSDIPALKEGEILLKTVYLSNDPAQRGWISHHPNPDRLYLPPVHLNSVMHARGIAEVLESKSQRLNKGDLVSASMGWKEYSVLPAADCTPLPQIPGLKPTYFLGALGLTGMTALYGLRDITRAGPSDTVVISGAAGATGSMAVQIAKHMLGCKRVIGIAGSEDKCRWVESLGAALCINYKSPSFKADLKKATEGYVDVYFDNVGGAILDLMLTRMARHGRVAACGAVSEYNDSQSSGLKNWFDVISMRIEIRGFIVLDFAPKMAEATQELIRAWKEGKVKIGDEGETVVEEGFGEVPQTWMKLFEGGNTGKLLTKIKYGESAQL